MLLGSLLDAGLALEDLQADLSCLDMGPYRLIAQRVTRQGLTGTHLRVLEGSTNRPAVNLPAIEGIVGGSSLPERVKARSLAVFRRLARAEAAIHGTSVDDVHFHEIGAVDSLVDIVGLCLRPGAVGHRGRLQLAAGAGRRHDPDGARPAARSRPGDAGAAGRGRRAHRCPARPRPNW